MGIEDVLYQKDSSITSGSIGVTRSYSLDIVIQQVLEGNWGNISLPLSSWQIAELEDLQSVSGIRCLITMWFDGGRDFVQGMVKLWLKMPFQWKINRNQGL